MCIVWLRQIISIPQSIEIFVFVDCRRSFDGGSSYLRVADNNHKRLGERGLPTVDDGNIVFNDTFVLDVKKEYSVQLYFDGHQSVRIGK